jgi:4-hydroxy-4-methyl-2-oxoglutarate aldolase
LIGRYQTLNLQYGCLYANFSSGSLKNPCIFATGAPNKGKIMPNNPAVTIHKNITRPTADIVKQFTVPTGYIADVQGRRGALDCGIKPFFEFPAFAGPAVTVKTVPDDNLAVFAAMGVVQAGDVLVIATDNWTGSAVLGDLVAAMFNNIGIAGVVTDGAVRDVIGIRQVGLPVYARGLTANSSQKNGPGTIGAEISIGGVIIRSGDLIVGDRGCRSAPGKNL